MGKVRLAGYKTVHVAVVDGRTACGHGAPTPLEAATGPVTCQRCLRWAEKRGVAVQMGWRRRVRVVVAGWLRRLAGWVEP